MRPSPDRRDRTAPLPRRRAPRRLRFGKGAEQRPTANDEAPLRGPDYLRLGGNDFRATFEPPSPRTIGRLTLLLLAGALLAIGYFFRQP